ncbi:Ecm33 protein [Saccharomycopsis crataegensis]|uniref:Ecm33 protein n=1 Tax=Saccharomycopsis crataegensis TaxID=43959 RepID=A0AAV5QUL4_9ASCO|nr:Ecm33 protein [Saccharomycopsis crataegensis]
MQFRTALVSSILAATALASNSTVTSATSSSYATPSASGTATCTYSKGYTATAAADIQKIVGCSTFDGDIYIEGDAITSVNLANVEQIVGSLTVNSATQLTSFVADSLIAVSDTLTLTNLTILEDLELPRLYKVGSLQFQALPAVGVLSFTNGLEEVGSILISDTSLTNITGMVFTTADTIDINNNNDLESFEISTLKTVSTALGVTYNSEDIDVAFEDLIWANNITFRDVSSISMDNLTAVNASLGFFNTSVESIVLDNLETVGGTLSITGNSDLAEIDMSSLTSIGGAFIISNNNDLQSINGFDSLKTVGGAITFTGDFTNATLSSLSSVKGGATIESTGDLDCSAFNKLSKKGAIQGKGYKCTSPHTSVSAKASKSTSSGSSSSSDSSSSSSTSTSKAAGDIVATSFGGIFAAFALSFF